ncbi:NAD(P)H-binding protein [Amycolatopsis sp. PS_44_ISF1]|uniref:SDR family oxidoreductase n=1 Tax=Amycolatopsis sp. PS_44_ISF1 TaxID=2974917 RepID=UPI0028E00E29|nr:NAD(P)H-binding protein [Amycolatopsis sp. PS_44_ISF1]MDT8909495.1 NAD(P)H-binding protein [Amycolatopsis sp. PS_44_ISF1]
MIVVTGATGNVGRPLAQALAQAGEQVTAVSRHEAAAPEGGRHVVADLSDPAGLDAALTGAKAVFLLLSGDMHAATASPAETVRRAEAHGVRRIVLLSSQGVATRPHGATRVLVRAVEDAIRESTMDWSILRPGGFASNALGWAESVRTRRMVAAPFGDIGVPVVDPADIAAMAAACLLDERTTGEVYELTGPEVITPRRQAEVIAAELGSPVEFQELTRAEAKAVMVQHGPPELADDTLDIIGAPSPAELRISPDIQRVLGRAPSSFADWTARNIAAFR